MKFSKTLILLLASTLLLSQFSLAGLNDHTKEPLQDGEEYTDAALAEMEEDAKSLQNLQELLWKKDDFFAEYNSANPTHVEVVMAKKYFPTRDTTIDQERYRVLLKMYMDGTVHDEEIDEDIREEAHAQIQEFVDEFIQLESATKNEFTVDDLFDDFLGGKFHDWLKKAHPQDDPEIEGDL